MKTRQRDDVKASKCTQPPCLWEPGESRRQPSRAAVGLDVPAHTELALPGTSHPLQGTHCPAGFPPLTKAYMARLVKWMSSSLTFCLTVLCQMHRYTIYSCCRTQFIKKYKEFPSVTSTCPHLFNYPSLPPAGWELSG